MIGNNSGCGSRYGCSNVFLGGGSAVGNYDGSCNIAIGRCSGPYTVNQGNGNLNFSGGWRTGSCLLTGHSNVFLGVNAGVGYTSGSNNISIGSTVGPQTCGASGNNNIAIGSSSGFNISTGKCNILLGDCVGTALSTASNNILIGSCAGKKITGSTSILIGNRAGCDLVNASGIGIGHQVFEGKTGGGGNIAIGQEAGREDVPSVTGANSVNIMIGTQAGRGMESQGHRNIYLGCKSGRYNSSHTANNDDNVYIGTCAGFGVGDYNVRACHIKCNIMIGRRAGADVSRGPTEKAEQNIILGNCTFYQGRGACNIYFGPHAATYTSGCGYGDANIGIGLSVQMPQQCGSNQLAIGQTSNYWIVGDQNFNVGIGTTIPTNKVNPGNTQTFAAGIVTAYQISAAFFSAACNNGFGGNIAIGNSFTGNISTTATSHSRVIAIGNNAGCQDTRHNNIFLGDQSGKNIVNGQDNIAMGGCSFGHYSANICGSNNIVFGENSAPAICHASNNIMMGDDAAPLTKFAQDNLGLGRAVLSHNIMGCYNIALGKCAGRVAIGPGVPGITTAGLGNNNIFLGCCATAPHSNPSNYLVIGNGPQTLGGTTFDETTNWIIGDPNYNIGLGIGTPTSKLHVKGDSIVTGVVTATSFVGALPIANDANNRLITATGSGGLNAESGVTYDGNTFLVGAEYLTLTGTGYKQITAATTTNNSAAIKLQNSAKNYTITNVTGGTFQIGEAGVSRFQIANGNVSVINSTI